MKKCIFLAVFGATMALCLQPTGASAQKDHPVAMAATASVLNTLTNTDPNPGGKDDASRTVKLDASDVSAKAIRSLQSYYKEATDASWSALNRSFLAEFEKEGRKTKALFTKSGYMIYGITYGTEQDLPKEERRVLKSNYIDYEITSVAKVLADNEVFWISTLQDKDNIVITRSHNGTMEELKHLAKHYVPKGRKGRVIIPN